MAGSLQSLQSLHSPAALSLSRLFFSLCRRTSWRSGRCRRRRSYSWRLWGTGGSASGFSLPCSACMAGCGAVLFGEVGATGPWSGCSSTCLAAARRILSCSLREMRCLSAHSSHRVCPSIASFPQFLQRPKNLASLSVSLNLARRLSFLASGVSEADFCFLFVLASSEVSLGGTREAVLRVGCSPVGVPVERFLLAVLLFALDAALYLLSTRAGSRNVYWRIILLEYCAGSESGDEPARIIDGTGKSS